MSLDSIIGIIGVVLTAIGTILTIRSLNQATPFYTVHEISLFQNRKNLIDQENLKILYEGNILSQVFISQFAFWNGGNKLLSFENASSHIPLSFMFAKDCKIINVELQFQSNEFNATSVKIDHKSNCVYITFDYLNSKDGFIIKIIHDQSNSNKFKVQGAFKGSSNLKLSNEQAGSIDWIESLTLIIGLIVLTLASAKEISSQTSLIIVLAYCFLVIIIACRHIIFRRPSIIPKKLRNSF